MESRKKNLIVITNKFFLSKIKDLSNLVDLPIQQWRRGLRKLKINLKKISFNGPNSNILFDSAVSLIRSIVSSATSS